MLSKNKNSRVRKVDIFTLEMREDGILRLYADPDEVVNMTRYEIMIKTIGELTNGAKVPMLSTAGEFTIPDEEVRRHMADPASNPYCLATAMVAPSLSQKLMGNVYAHTVMKERPTRLFRTEDEAIAWLKTVL